MTPVPVFLTLTVAPGTGPPCSSVIRPESVAPETWARVGAAEKRAKARASDRQIHFAKDELQPLLNIIIPLARSPMDRHGLFVASAGAQKRFALDRPADWCCANVSGIAKECNPRCVQSKTFLHPRL